MFFGGGFPGGGGGGFPGGMGGGGGSVDNDAFYEILNVSKEVSSNDLKKAYRKLAMKHHPDKGGDEAEFKQIQEAYDCLSDPEKRDLYDKYGKEGLEQGGRGGGGGDDIFSMLFRQQNGGGRRGPEKGEDVVHPLKVTLENLCNGKTVKLSINRQRVQYPEGMDAESAISVCETCRGRRVVMKTAQIGPGMIQQMQVKCPACNGAGKTYKKGVKVVKEKKILEVHVMKGMKHRQKIVFSGEADEAPGVLAGDVVFIIDQQEHDTFQRKGADLVMEKTITLQEALSGFAYPQKHPDGRTLIVKSPAGEVVKPNAIKCITDGGMPIYKRPFSRGRLFVVYKVTFPDKLTVPQVTAIKASLPGPTKTPVIHKGEDVEEVSMFDSTVEQIGQIAASAGSASAYDSDDEEGANGQQRVQCQQS